MATNLKGRRVILQKLLRFLKGVVVIALIVGLAVGISFLIYMGYQYQWTGFGEATHVVGPSNEYIPSKTLWDWLELLIIPFVIALSALVFSWLERRNAQNIAKKQLEEDRRIADDRAQEATLESYLAQLSFLLLEKELARSSPESDVRDVARAWTLTVLRRLSGERKGVVLRILAESGLISKDGGIVSLADADLTNAHLQGAYLRAVYLLRVNLENANLVGADLAASCLVGANLAGAHLEDANLAGAHLEDANLVDIQLKVAHLEGAHLERADLEDAQLAGAHLEDAHLEGANLVGADLAGAHLAGTHLQGSKYSQETKQTKWPEGFDYVSAGAILGKINTGLPRSLM